MMPLIVQVELTASTAMLLKEIFGENQMPSFAWPGGAGAIPDVGEWVHFTHMEDHPMRVVSRRWEIAPTEFRLILQLGIEG